VKCGEPWRDGLITLNLQIFTLMAKYWLRIKDLSFNNTLVGEAAKCCIESKQQPVAVTIYFLQLCNINVQVNALDVSPKQLGTMGKYLKKRSRDNFVKFWKDQVQQGDNTGKLWIFRKVKTRFGLSDIFLKFKILKPSSCDKT
jgi:hypothetical protein